MRPTAPVGSHDDQIRVQCRCPLSYPLSGVALATMDLDRNLGAFCLRDGDELFDTLLDLLSDACDALGSLQAVFVQGFQEMGSRDQVTHMDSRAACASQGECVQQGCLGKGRKVHRHQDPTP